MFNSQIFDLSWTRCQQRWKITRRCFSTHSTTLYRFSPSFKLRGILSNGGGIFIPAECRRTLKKLAKSNHTYMRLFSESFPQFSGFLFVLHQKELPSSPIKTVLNYLVWIYIQLSCLLLVRT